VQALKRKKTNINMLLFIIGRLLMDNAL